MGTNDYLNNPTPFTKHEFIALWECLPDMPDEWEYLTDDIKYNYMKLKKKFEDWIKGMDDCEGVREVWKEVDDGK